MLAARATVVPLTAFVSHISRKPLTVRSVIQTANLTKPRHFSDKVRYGRFSRREAAKDVKSQIKEKAMAPAGETAFTAGRIGVATAAAFGLGAMCFYGAGLGNEQGVIERTAYWPQYVRDRVRDTYMYFGGGIGVTAMSAVAAARNAKLMNFMTKNSLLAIGGTIALIIGSNVMVHAMPYKKGFGAKQLAWLAHAGLMGAVVAPITFLGGPILVRAAWYTAGVVGGLSALAMCAPNQKFLNMGGPLACGLGVVFASSIAGAFLPPTSALGAGLYSISVYGGLVLFCMFLLYDTQKIMHRAETHPLYAAQPFDPVNGSLGIYADTLNIFIRLAMILSGGGGRRK